MPSSSAQIGAFARALQRLTMRYMRIVGEQSATHDTFSKQELLALNVLEVRGPSRMGEIAVHLGVGQSAVTPLVDRLESEGVVRRRRGDADRRVWLVELTDAGAQAVSAENEVLRGLAAEVLAPLSEGERATLLGLFERIAAAGSAA